MNAGESTFDATFENHGSIVLMRPHTTEAFDFLRDAAPSDAQYFGDALAIEHRYAVDVYQAAVAYGLRCDIEN